MLAFLKVRLTLQTNIVVNKEILKEMNWLDDK